MVRRFEASGSLVQMAGCPVLTTAVRYACVVGRNTSFDAMRWILAPGRRADPGPDYLGAAWASRPVRF